MNFETAQIHFFNSTFPLSPEGSSTRIRVFLKPYIDTQRPRMNERIRPFRVDGGANRVKNSMHFQIKNILILVDVISS